MRIIMIIAFAAICSCQTRTTEDLKYDVTYNQINGSCVDIGNRLLAMPMIDVFNLVSKDDVHGIVMFEVQSSGPGENKYPTKIDYGKKYTIHVVRTDDIEKQLKNNASRRIVIFKKDIRNIENVPNQAVKPSP